MIQTLLQPFVNFFHTFQRALVGFFKDRLSLFASAITFYTLLAIIPSVAIILGIAQGFGLDTAVKEAIQTQFESYALVGQKLLEFAERSLKEVRGDLIAGVGVVILLWTVLKLLRSIEEAFDFIFRIQEKRSFGHRLLHFVAIAWTAPFLLIVGYSVVLFIIAKVMQLVKQMPVIGIHPHLFDALLHLFPLALTILTLFLLYIWMPSRKIGWKEAFYGSVVGSVLLHLFQFFYIYLQVGVTRYGAIYGSLAAFPLFIIWLQISWMIVLFGAEFAFHQLEIRSPFKPFSQESPYYQKITWIALLQLVDIRFKEGRGFYRPKDLARELNLSLPSFYEALNPLLDKELVLEKDNLILPGRDIQQISPEELIAILEGKNTLPSKGLSLAQTQANQHLHSLK